LTFTSTSLIRGVVIPTHQTFKLSISTSQRATKGLMLLVFLFSVSVVLADDCPFPPPPLPWPAVYQAEETALQKIFEGLNISSDIVISSLSHCCWDDVTCNIDTSVTELSARAMVGGFLAPEIGQLSSLVSLDLVGQRFSKCIPSTLGKLSSLAYLTLQGFSCGLEGLDLRSTKLVEFNLHGPATFPGRFLDRCFFPSRWSRSISPTCRSTRSCSKI
jgi:hypothetical protein